MIILHVAPPRRALPSPLFVRLHLAAKLRPQSQARPSGRSRDWSPPPPPPPVGSWGPGFMPTPELGGSVEGSMIRVTGSTQGELLLTASPFGIGPDWGHRCPVRLTKPITG
eukprot:SAG11_NODE_2685_length_3101_cov_1.843771_5_plen_111_part_00